MNRLESTRILNADLLAMRIVAQMAMQSDHSNKLAKDIYTIVSLMLEGTEQSHRMVHSAITNGGINNE